VKSVRWMISYILVASLGLWLAFAVSMRFMTPAHSQNPPAAAPGAASGAPTSGDLPPEFMNETGAPPQPQEAQPQQQQLPPPQHPPGHPEMNPSASQGAILPSGPSNGGGPPPGSRPPQLPPPPPTAIEDMPTGDSATASEAMEERPNDNFVYDPTGKRDPFVPFKIMRPQIKIGGDKANLPMEPLQNWELDSLQIVGILWDVKVPRALVKDPSGTVYTVTRNSKIGRNEGYVSAIREGEIVIVETRYEEGKTIKESHVMEFKK